MEDKKAVDARPSCLSRREFCSTALGASLMAMVPPGVRSGAWAAGSDAPEKKEVRIGFIPLTDCASVVMASVLGFDKKHGIKIILGCKFTNSSLISQIIKCRRKLMCKKISRQIADLSGTEY